MNHSAVHLTALVATLFGGVAWVADNAARLAARTC